MIIISGLARGIRIETPPGLTVRPTAGRSRKALFDSIGRFDDASVVDLFAGSGALGLEAASRGASSVTLVENDHRCCRVIGRNVEAVLKTGVAADIRLVEAAAPAVYSWESIKPDVIFADPPYPESLRHWQTLLRDESFRRAASGSLLIWEIPGNPGSLGPFLADNRMENWRIRRFGGTDFLIGRLPEDPDVQS